MALLSTTPIPNQLSLPWGYVVLTYFYYDALNYEGGVVLNLYKDDNSFLANASATVPTNPKLEFKISLDPNFPFQELRKSKPNLVIVEQHSDPQSSDEITQGELTALRDNFDGYILTQSEIAQLFIGDTTALLYTYGRKFINEKCNIPLTDITIV